MIPLKDAKPPLFESTADADYRTMLGAIEVGHRRMLEAPEADMPGFRSARKEP